MEKKSKPAFFNHETHYLSYNERNSEHKNSNKRNFIKKCKQLEVGETLTPVTLPQFCEIQFLRRSILSKFFMLILAFFIHCFVPPSTLRFFQKCVFQKKRETLVFCDF